VLQRSSATIESKPQCFVLFDNNKHLTKNTQGGKISSESGDRMGSQNFRGY
jgi:hypothetical protein